MKSVLISIQPKWVKKIASGEKTIEVRKTRPKLETPFKCYIYCTEGDALAYPCINYPKFDIHRANNGTLKGRLMTKKEREQSDYLYANGKVIGEFVCDKITDISVVVKNCNENYNHVYHNDECKGSCLTWKELQEYGKGKPLYGWHITDLKIYDKPKDLSGFIKYMDCKNTYDCCACHNWDRLNLKCIAMNNELHRPPQSWCYVENGV